MFDAWDEVQEIMIQSENMNQKQTARRMAADGYANAAAFLGEDSPLFAAGTFLRSGLTSDPELLTAMYREN